jgi:hypothetical protein
MYKKILFIAHGNNDIDHYLPIISKLNKRLFDITLFFIADNNSFKINSLHNFILRKNKTKIVEANIFLTNKFINFVYACNLRFRKYKLSNIQNKNFYNFFNIISYFTDKFLFLLVKNFISKNNFYNFIKNRKFNIIIIDTIKLSKEDLKANFFKYTIFNLMKIAKSIKVPIFMVSHGANILYLRNSKKEKNVTGIKPDLLSVCNLSEVNFYQNYAKNKKSIKVLGDIKYDYQWINFLRKINKKMIKQFYKKNNKIKILYAMGNLNFLNNNIEKKINEEIYNLLIDLKNIELWVKIHPRSNISFNNYRHENLKIFDHNTDISSLIDLSNIVLSTHSGVLFQSIMQGKKNILYDSWKNKIKNSWTIFDKTPCVQNISNYNDLKNEIFQFKNSKNYSKNEIEKFYKKFVSGNTPLNGSITNKYIDNINYLLKKESNMKCI